MMCLGCSYAILGKSRLNRRFDFMTYARQLINCRKTLNEVPNIEKNYANQRFQAGLLLDYGCVAIRGVSRVSEYLSEMLALRSFLGHAPEKTPLLIARTLSLDSCCLKNRF